MDFSIAKEYARNAADIMGKKSRESGFDQSGTAAGQLCLAFAALLDALEQKPENYPTGLPGTPAHVDEEKPFPGVFSGNGKINPPDGGTSPYRHWTDMEINAIMRRQA